MTSEQQAVPVAQIDVDLANKIGAAFDYNAGPEETWLEEMLARHRLASLPCKSGEGAGDDEHGDIATIAYMMGAKDERDRLTALSTPSEQFAKSSPDAELREAAERLLLRWKGKSTIPMVKLMAKLNSALEAQVTK